MIETEKPKYQKLKEYIVEAIQSHKIKVGEKIYSENVLAEKFEISRHTVRQALGELVNEGWLYKVQGKGTFVNRSPEETVNTSKTIGVITTYLNDYIFPSIIRGIDSVLSVNGYNISLSCTYNQHEKERLCLENFANQNIAALIVEPTKSALPNPNIDLYEKFSNLGIPILFIHGCYKELNYSFIVEDDVEAGYLATKHLIDLGHVNIAGIFKIDDIQGHYRFAGFQKAHLDANLRSSDSRILWFETSDMEANFKPQSVQFNNLLTDCSAIVCYNDEVSIKVMDMIREKKLNIPENLSLVSFDDSQLALVSQTKLTTVAHPKEKLGEEAAKAIINIINRTKDYYDLKMKPELIVRESTKIYVRS
ncbi:GntR family transcriptional regulator [Clostridium sp. SYSU_GA19001]|uniref:GntR family transcriptional regulator n=1 Tax=Clostridium caldaquaticum TaxID=2940653 RepID=UPI0020779006|nr:GntR family transcriptional regulator [Clostridium caldaquaticum]MCM8709692.1 GntR family transcriptional regulator [Clostridium caldaquaticum]